jgi:hypothetical protein
MIDAIQKAVRALGRLSDSDWLQVKCDEDRRRARDVTAQQREIRNLAKRYREVRDQKAPAR